VSGRTHARAAPALQRGLGRLLELLAQLIAGQAPRRRDGARLTGFAYSGAERIERLADQRRELEDVLLVKSVEVASGAPVGQLQHPIRPSARAADARREPAPHRWMTGRESAEVTKERMVQHLVFR